MKRLVILALACAAIPAGALAASNAPFKPKLDAPAAADWRTVDPENLLVIDTTKGRILVEMAPEIAPKSVERIKTLAHQHFYDGLTFHRVIDGFMAQGGDPKGDGTGGSTLPDIPGEFTFRHTSSPPYVKVSSDKGVEDGFIKSVPVRGQSSDLAVMTADGKVTAWGLFCTASAGMARSQDPNSGNSQFFFMRDARDELNQNYTVWGRVLVGEDVVKALKTGEPVVDPDKMTSVRLAADLPPDQRPVVQVVDAGSAWARTAAKYAASVCDIDLPAKVVNQPQAVASQH